MCVSNRGLEENIEEKAKKQKNKKEQKMIIEHN